MKECCTCHQWLPKSEFNKRAAAWDGLQSRCRGCSREWYLVNRKAHMKNVKRRNDEERECIKKWLLEYLTNNSCVDCGETDLRVLEFDHRPGTDKVASVGELIAHSYGRKAVMREIAKCDVRCANCHRKITYERAGSWRHTVYYEAIDGAAEGLPVLLA